MRLSLLGSLLRPSWCKRRDRIFASILGIGQLSPIEIRATERHEYELGTAHGDDVHLAEFNRSRWPLIIYGHDVGLSKVWNEQE